MTKKEQELYDALIALSKKFSSVLSNIYYLDISKTFSINLTGFNSAEVELLTKFCEKYNLDWNVIGAVGLNERGVTILFNNKLTKK